MDGTVFSRHGAIVRALASSLCLLVTATSCACVASPRHPDTTEWRQTDADSGHTSYVRGPIKPPLKTTWSVLTDAETGPVVAYGNDLFILGKHTISAVRTPDGTVRWSHRLNGDVGLAYEDAAQSRFDWNFLATGAIVYCTGLDGQIDLLSRQDGHLIGKQEIGPHLHGGVFAGYRDGGCVSVSAPEDDPPGAMLVLRGRDGTVVNDGRNPYFIGAVYWPECPYRVGTLGPYSTWVFVQTRHGLFTFESPMSRARGLRYLSESLYTESVADSDHVYLSENGYIRCLNKQLKVVWENFESRADKSGRPDLPHPLLLAPNTVVFYNWVHLSGFDKRSGRRLWTITLPQPYSNLWWWHYTHPVIVGSFLYAAVPGAPTKPEANVDTLVCVDVRTGRTIWKSKVAHNIVSMIAHRQSLYILDDLDDLNPRKQSQMLPLHRRLIRLDPIRHARRRRH